MKTTYLTRYLHPRYHWICTLSTVLDCNLSGNIPIHLHLETVRSLEMICNFHFCSNFDFYDFNDFCFQLYLANFNLGRPSRCIWVFYRYSIHSVQDIQDSDRWTARMDFSDAPWYLMAKICSKTVYFSAKIRRNPCDAQRIWVTFLNLPGIQHHPWSLYAVFHCQLLLRKYEKFCQIGDTSSRNLNNSGIYCSPQRGYLDWTQYFWGRLPKCD